MKPKTFNISFLIIAIALLTIITVFNYVVDPYGINLSVTRKSFNYNKPEFVWHTRQLKPFLSDIIKPKVVFLGNSRIEYLAPEKYFISESDDSYFNFGLSSGTVNEMHEFLQYSHNNYEISKVIYGLDFISFTSFSPDFHQTFDLELVRGNKLKIIEKLKMYLSYQAISKSLTCIESNRHDPEGFKVIYQYNKYGSRTNRWREINLEKRGNGWLKNSFKGSYKLYKDIYTDEEFHVQESKLDAYEEITDYIRNNQIEYIAFISPIFQSHFKLLLALDCFDDYINWLEFLSEQTGYYYMGGTNKFTSDTSLYWDTQHARKEMSSHIFNTIIKGSVDTKDSLWGLYIDQSNFAYLKTALINKRNALLAEIEK